MRKIKLFVIAVLALFSFNLYADAKAIKESKLTSLSYVKKICKITETHKTENYCFYTLDNGKGYLYIDDEYKVCNC